MGGKEYSKGFTCMGYGDAGSEIYFNVEGKYTTISFITGTVEISRQDNVEFTIKADGDIVYSDTMKVTDLPTNHSVTINKCSQLEFIINDGRWVADGSGTYGIADIILYP